LQWTPRQKLLKVCRQDPKTTIVQTQAGLRRYPPPRVDLKVVLQPKDQTIQNLVVDRHPRNEAQFTCYPFRLLVGLVLDKESDWRANIPAHKLLGPHLENVLSRFQHVHQPKQHGILKQLTLGLIDGYD
jgi:hypothetical protein